MTTLHWAFDPGKEIPIECHAYRPAPVAPPVVGPCGLDWRTVGQLLAGALWLGVGIGLLIAIIAGI